MAEALKLRFTVQLIQAIGEVFQREYANFSPAQFEAEVIDEDWNARELKDRMRHITCCLHQQLPKEFEEAVPILNKAASQFKNDFIFIFFPDYVEQYGIKQPDLALPALKWMTRFSSSEFAIRPFLIQYQNQTLDQLIDWTNDENHHVRRLASEGCRPRLPWAMALPEFKANPNPILPILGRLRADTSEYVRRSVANNLNDIAKDHPEVVVNHIEAWQGESEETDRLLKHAARTLLKQGHTRTLRLFGFGDPSQVEILQFLGSSESISIGDDLLLNLQFKVGGRAKKRLRLEYRVYFVKANGKASPKIFHISESEFEPGIHALKRSHSFLNRTTRKHYPGEHRFELVVNGLGKADFCVQLNF